MIRPAVALTFAALALMAGSLAFGFRDAPSQGARGGTMGSLTWRQLEILHVRAKTHACTDALGRSRFRVEDVVVRGGPAYRRWVLELWRYRARMACGMAERRRASVVRGMWYEIAVCESGRRPPAWHINTGNGFYGGLQFLTSTWLAYGGGRYAPRADLASPSQQVQIASGMSLSHWPVCGRPYR